MFNGAIGYRCSVCGKVLERDCFGDSQKHLLKHVGVFAKLIEIEDEKKNSSMHGG